MTLHCEICGDDLPVHGVCVCDYIVRACEDCGQRLNRDGDCPTCDWTPGEAA